MVPRRNLLTAAGFAVLAVVWTVATHNYSALLIAVAGIAVFAVTLGRMRRRDRNG
jgi:Flp pilus assembly protein TadB